MSTHDSDILSFEDDGDFFEDPLFAAAYEDAATRSQLLADLCKQRKAMRLSQKQVAAHMETTQSFVSEFENGATDPHLSTFQRYARAVAARLEVRIGLPADCFWQPHDRTVYEPANNSDARTEPATEAVEIRDESRLPSAWRSTMRADNGLTRVDFGLAR